jgi:hypothetical protein
MRQSQTSRVEQAMNQSRSDVPRTPRPPPPRQRSWLAKLLSERSVQITLIAWLVANALILAIAQGELPFDRPALEGSSFLFQVVSANLLPVEVILVMGVVYALTRKRMVPDMAARAPERATALRETLLLVAYGILGQFGGFILGQALGWHAFSFHIVGTLHGTHEMIEPAEAFVWASYNLVVYAIAPYLFFRRRYSAEALNLKSSNRRNDALVIVVVLLIESLIQLGVSSAILDLSPRQLLLGAPLTFVLYFLGTVLPTMVFIYCILVPRYLKLTGSAATTVILGGLTYTLVHFFDGWTLFNSPGNAVLTVVFLLLQYFGPGMIKTFLTLRTGNAWVHVWAYHAFVPHVIFDTPLIAKIFHIR